MKNRFDYFNFKLKLFIFIKTAQLTCLTPSPFLYMTDTLMQESTDPNSQAFKAKGKALNKFFWRKKKILQFFQNNDIWWM